MAVAQRGTLWELIVEAKTLLVRSREYEELNLDDQEMFQSEYEKWKKRLQETVKMEAEEHKDAKSAFIQKAYGGSPAEDAETGRHEEDCNLMQRTKDLALGCTCHGLGEDARETKCCSHEEDTCRRGSDIPGDCIDHPGVPCDGDCCPHVQKVSDLGRLPQQ